MLPEEEEGDTSAVAGVVLIGDTHLQPHPLDLAPGAIDVTDFAAKGGIEVGKPMIGSSTMPHHLIFCTRCSTSLGVLILPPSNPLAAQSDIAIAEKKKESPSKHTLPHISHSNNSGDINMLESSDLITNFLRPSTPLHTVLTSANYPVMKIYKDRV